MFGDRLTGLSQRLDQERREQAALGEGRRLLRLLDSTGHKIRLGEGDDIISVSPRPPEDVAVALRRVKPALISLLKAQAPPK